MTTREIQDEILRLKKEKEVCILAHAYQNHEILEVADYMGDSFAFHRSTDCRRVYRSEHDYHHITDGEHRCALELNQARST